MTVQTIVVLSLSELTEHRWIECHQRALRRWFAAKSPLILMPREEIKCIQYFRKYKLN